MRCLKLPSLNSHKTTNTWACDSQRKIIEPCDLEDTVQRLKFGGARIATLNGSFDLLHAGHLHIIYSASQVADILIVCLNSDASIQKYKSPTRPIIPLEYRLQMMAALGFVDFVTYFKETDPTRILSIIQPHVHVNGSEYCEECLEADIVKKYGGEIHIVDLVPSLSTSNIINKIHQLCV